MAVRKIAQLFDENEDHDIQVEILNDEKLYHNSQAYHMTTPQDVVTSFQILHDDFVDFADQYLTNQWHSLIPGLCVNEAGKRIAVVYFLVHENASCHWDQAMSAFEQRFNNTSFAMRLQPGTVFPLGSQPSDLTNQASVCIAGDLESYGTLGFFVDIQVPDEAFCPPGLEMGDNHCVVSNHHVVASPEKESWLDAWTSGIKALSGIRHQVMSPSTYWLKMEKQKYSNMLETEKTTLKQIQTAHPYEVDSIKETQTAIRNLEEKLTKFSSDEAHCIGEVFLSSGIRACTTPGCSFSTSRKSSSNCTSDHELLDFALIRLDSGLRFPNLIPKYRDFESIKGRKILGYGVPAIATSHSITAEHPTVISPKVYKDGARTGVTTGITENWAAMRRNDECPTDKNSKKEVYCHSWVVRNGSSDQTCFSDSGDSGSLVTDTKYAVGQIHSGWHDGRDVYLSFMTSIGAILDTIQKSLPGCKVKLVTELQKDSSWMSQWRRWWD